MIIHDGEELVVHHHPGSSRTTLVTFMGIGMEPDARQTYLLQGFATEEGFDCFGVTTKVRGFYLTEEMDAVIASIQAARGADTRRLVAFGQSMGGYAAIKYSRRLGADAAIALSPQYTVDLDELGLTDDAQIAIFRAAFAQYAILPRDCYRQMGVREADCCPAVFVIYDPSMLDDCFYSDMYRKNLPSVRTVPFYRGGHALLEHLSSNRSLFKILHAAATDAAQEVVDAVFDIQLGHDSLNIHKDSTSNNALVFNLLQAGRIKDALTYFTLCAHHNFGIGSGFPDAAELDEASYAKQLRQHPFLMVSQHGYFLSYSIGTQSLMLGASPFGAEDISPVFVTLDDMDTIRLFIMSRGAPLDIRPGGTSPTDCGPCVLRKENGVVCIAAAAQLLTADAAGQLCLRDVATGDAERFVAIPVAAESPLLQRASLNWFNSSVVQARSQKPPDRKARLLSRLLARTKRREPPRQSGPV